MLSHEHLGLVFLAGLTFIALCAPVSYASQCSTVHVSSWGFKYAQQRADGRQKIGTIEVLKKESRSACTLGSSFGVNQNNIVWVDHGCRAVFTVCEEEAVVEPADCFDKADVLFVVDSSRMIGSNTFERVKDYIVEFTDLLDVASGKVHVGIVQYSDDVSYPFTFMDSQSHDSVHQTVSELQYLKGSANTANALVYANNEVFSAARGARPGVSRVTIVLTAGLSSDTVATARAAGDLQSSHPTTVMAIGVGPEVDPMELRAIASSEDLVYMGTSSLAPAQDINSRFLTTECTTPPPPPPPPPPMADCVTSCEGRPDGNYRACSPKCMEGYYITCANQRFFEMPCALAWYVHPDNRRYLAKMVYVAESDSCERSAGYCPRNPFDYQEEIPEPSRPFIPVLLRPDRSCVSTSCVGRPNGNYPSCDKCDQGIYISCSNDHLYEMPCPLGWYVDSHNRRYTSKMVYVAKSDTCELSAGYCPRNPGDYEENAPEVPAPPVTVPECKDQADVLFVVDSSGSISSSDYSTMKQYLAQIAQKLNVSPEGVHISALLFSTNVENRFGFGEYLDVTGVQQALLSMPHMQDLTYTADALAFARTDSFTASNGARPGVSRVAVVLTDGRSRNFDATVAAARELRDDTGVTVLAVGVGPEVDREELLEIASPGRVFTVDNFAALYDIENDLLTRICMDVELPPPDVTPLEPTSSCYGKIDGDYPAGHDVCADGVFYSCVAGYRYLRHCADGNYVVDNNQAEHTIRRTVYDPSTRRCEHATSYCPRPELSLPVS